MRLLLDTHIWLWIHREPWHLTAEVNQILADPETDLWLSPVSIWELTTLLEKKRVSLLEDVNEWVEKSRRELSLREAPFTWEVARELRFTLTPDPADRFLAATAKVFGLTLVTADSRLIRLPDLRILANR